MAHQVPIEHTLDLHAFTPRDVPSVVEAFVTEAQGHGLDEIRLVHGRGIGVQRRAVHTVLTRHPLVRDFWDAPDSHLGATIVRLVTATP